MRREGFERLWREEVFRIKNSRKRRDGFQFVTPEKMKIFFAPSALQLWNSLPQDTTAGKEIQEKKKKTF